MLGLDTIVGVGMKLIDKLIPDPQAKAQAQLDLAKLAQEGKLAEIQADTVAMQETSKRWQADMASDSWLSKNIRPMTLVFILLVFCAFSLMSAWKIDVNESYVKLLGEWGQLIMLAYFGGRTVEKIMDMKAKKDADK
jgi:Holin of 3TMs, for gene-transfer release